MKVDAGVLGELRDVPARARALEEAGYDGLMTAETAHDPFLPVVLAAEHTERVELMTSIAVAFARTPMLLAVLGHDLNAYSQGRFILGLGSQIRAHVTKRFGMPWSHPARRMRELILAIRAIWACWYDGEKLDFRGEFYTHTLMTPFFTPTDTRHGAPPVYLAAVGKLMAEVAGEVADGLIAHAFTTERYLREITLPAIERGLARSGRSRPAFTLSCPVFIVSGEDDRACTASRRAVAQQIAFYGSTPAYRPVLELHGWGALQEELHRLSKQGRWEEMGERISDEMIETFAIVAEPDRIAEGLRARFGGLLDRIVCTYQPPSPEGQRELLEALKKL
ncbi:MAG: LLM class F420-dependent oxidoreductase [Myxococcota bacterium]